MRYSFFCNNHLKTVNLSIKHIASIFPKQITDKFPLFQKPGSDSHRFNVPETRIIVQISTTAYYDRQQLPETTFRQVFNLMLEYCHGRDAYVQFQDTLFAQVQALICNGKPIGGLIIDANKFFDKAKAEMLERKKNIELRLVSVDEPSQKRRELRAEMKGIDFCISVLDANR